jgi:hypothetical protein
MTDEQPLSAQQTALKAHLDAIISDVIVADSCYFLFKAIGESADAINKKNFGELFAFLQDGVISSYILTLARLFERPKKKYEIRGVPATLEFLLSNRDSIPFVERRMLTDALTMSCLEGLSDAELTGSAVAVIREKSPNAEGTELFDVLEGVRFRRDKTIAHNEIITVDEMRAVTWRNTQDLLDLAKTVVTAVGGGYFGVSHRLSFGKETVAYVLSADAERKAVALNRLLRSAGVLKKE